MPDNVLIVQYKHEAPRTTVGSSKIRENVVSRELVFITISIHVGEISRSCGWLSMIDGSRLLTIVTAC